MDVTNGVAMAVVVKGIGMCVPENKVKNEDLPESLQTSDEWIRSHTGIGSRFLASKEDTNTTLGAASSEKALTAAGINAGMLDLIIFTTTTPTYSGCPSDACLLQAALGADKAACFDLTAACSGFVYAADTAAALLERQGWKYALVCSTEILSRVADWSDRSTCVLFGDGSGSAVLENTAATGADCGNRGLKTVVLGAVGTGARSLYIEHGGFIKMDGHAVYNFAVASIASIIETLMEKESITLDDIDMIVCHQANSRIISAAAKRLSFPISKFIFNMEEYGNTSSASIPMTLASLEEKGTLKKGMRIIVAGFGSGLTNGGGVIIW